MTKQTPLFSLVHGTNTPETIKRSVGRIQELVYANPEASRAFFERIFTHDESFSPESIIPATEGSIDDPALDPTWLGDIQQAAILYFGDHGDAHVDFPPDVEKAARDQATKSATASLRMHRHVFAARSLLQPMGDLAA